MTDPRDDLRVVDASENQKVSLPWLKWYAERNVRMAILRQSTGLRMDRMFAQHFAEARAGYLWTLEYHDLTPLDDPEQQALFFAAHHPEGWRGIAFVDVETEGVTAAKLRAFRKAYNSVAKRPLGVYTSQGRWYDLIGHNAVEFADMPLWLAAWGQMLPGTSTPWTMSPELIDIWATKGWDFFQYAGDNGVLAPFVGAIDQSIYRYGWLDLGAMYYSFGEGPLDDVEIAALQTVYDQISGALKAFDAILHPVPVPPPLQWWDKLPSGVFPTGVVYATQTAPYFIYGPDGHQLLTGTPPAPIKRTNGGSFLERNGDLIRVTAIPPIAGLPNWWVKAEELTVHPS